MSRTIGLDDNRDLIDNSYPSDNYFNEMEDRKHNRQAQVIFLEMYLSMRLEARCKLLDVLSTIAACKQKAE